MLTKNFIIVFVFIFSSLLAQQEDGQYIHKHLVRVDASIVSGQQFNSIKNVYINGNAEYYLDNTISIRGDANYLMGSTGLTADSMGLKDNHSLMLGAVFHIQTKNHLDPYFILQPGIAYTSSYEQKYVAGENETGTEKTYYSGVVSPLGSAGLGFNYYFQRFAHLFVETRYIYGQHLSTAPNPLSLQEFRITFGLGFNLFVIKEKKKAA